MACGPRMLMQIPLLPKAGYSPMFGTNDSRGGYQRQTFWLAVFSIWGIIAVHLTPIYSTSSMQTIFQPVR
jgi:hypothetical protein